MRSTVPRVMGIELGENAPTRLVQYKLVETHQAIPNININTHEWSDKSFVAPIQTFTDLLP